jgi:hypothetical protein
LRGGSLIPLLFTMTPWKITNKRWGECSYHTPIRALFSTMKLSLIIPKSMVAAPPRYIIYHTVYREGTILNIVPSRGRKNREYLATFPSELHGELMHSSVANSWKGSQFCDSMATVRYSNWDKILDIPTIKGRVSRESCVNLGHWCLV